MSSISSVPPPGATPVRHAPPASRTDADGDNDGSTALKEANKAPPPKPAANPGSRVDVKA